MTDLLRAHRRVTVAWVFLLGTTGVVALLTELTTVPTAVTVLVLLIAAAKIAVILAEFMELRSGPVGWRLALGGWLGTVLTIVVVTFAW